MNMEKFYRDMAKKYGVSVPEVKRDMQAAIDEAYKNPNAAALAVPRKGAVPTVEEFIAYNTKEIERQRPAGKEVDPPKPDRMRPDGGSGFHLL